MPVLGRLAAAACCPALALAGPGRPSRERSEYRRVTTVLAPRMAGFESFDCTAAGRGRFRGRRRTPRCGAVGFRVHLFPPSGSGPRQPPFFRAQELERTCTVSRNVIDRKFTMDGEPFWGIVPFPKILRGFHPGNS